jgi:hypothetical protein
MRVTLTHDEVYKILENVVHDVEKYIIYPHVGKRTQKEHFHICIPINPNDDATKLSERYRKRAKALNGGGNSGVMCKTHANGCECFVSYVKHEVAQAHLKGFTQEWFDEIEVREERNIGAYMEHQPKKKPRNEDHFYQITYQNMERVTQRFRAEHGIKSDQLEVTLEAMHKAGWRLQVSVLRSGIPSQFYDEFTAKCKGQTSFTEGRFARMRMTEKWKEYSI